MVMKIVRITLRKGDAKNAIGLGSLPNMFGSLKVVIDIKTNWRFDQEATKHL